MRIVEFKNVFDANKYIDGKDGIVKIIPLSVMFNDKEGNLVNCIRYVVVEE